MNIKDNIKYIPALIITALLFIPFPPEIIKIYLHSVLPITVIIVITITLLCLYKKNCPKIITLFPQYFSLFNTILFVNTSRFIFDITLLKFDESYYVAKIVKDAFKKNIYFGYLQVALGFLAVYVIYRVSSRLCENKNVRIMQITLWTMLIISFAVLFGCSLNGYFKYEMTVFHSFIFYLPYSCCQFILWAISYFLLYGSLTIPEELSITANNI